MKRNGMRAIVVAGMAGISTLMMAGSASATTSGPAYYLSTSATYSGPCLNGGSSTEVSYPVTVYKATHTYSEEGDVTYYYTTQYGFNKAYRYVYCPYGNGSSGIQYKYYGANDGKIVRTVTTTQICYGDSCLPSVTTASAWQYKYWI